MSQMNLERGDRVRFHRSGWHLIQASLAKLLKGDSD